MRVAADNRRPRLSVIVPVYNMAAEDRLVHCMDSLTGQTVEERCPGSMEIIAVDDCSTDGSLRILRDYARRFPGLVRVIASPENRHQGGAKNLGLAEARGAWIGFIDADDWVTPDYYERLFSEADRTGADMVGCDYSLVDRYTLEPGERVPNNDEAQTGGLDRNKYRMLLLDSGSLVVKIYRREIIFGETDPLSGSEATGGMCVGAEKGEASGADVTQVVRREADGTGDLRHGSGTFPEGIFYEDNAVANTWMLRAKRFAYLPEPLYFYLQHDSSTVHTLSEKNLEDRLAAGRLMLRAARDGGYLEEYRQELEFLFTNLFYRNTLFSAMAVYREGRARRGKDGPTAVFRARRRESVYRFTKRLAQEMRRTFPDFQRNPYYLERIDAEERGFMALQMRSQALFYIKYRLLWMYRRVRVKK